MFYRSAEERLVSWDDAESLIHAEVAKHVVSP